MPIGEEDPPIAGAITESCSTCIATAHNASRSLLIRIYEPLGVSSEVGIFTRGRKDVTCNNASTTRRHRREHVSRSRRAPSMESHWLQLLPDNDEHEPLPYAPLAQGVTSYLETETIFREERQQEGETFLPIKSKRMTWSTSAIVDLHAVHETAPLNDLPFDCFFQGQAALCKLPRKSKVHSSAS